MYMRLPLERTLLLTILLASSCVTAVLTVASMVLDYKNEIGALKDSATNLRQSIVKPLGSLLYSGDEELIRIFAESILANREVECVEIVDTYSKAPNKKWCDTDTEIFNSYTYSFPIEFEGLSEKSPSSKENLGEVRLILSDRRIIENIKDRIITFILAQASKTFIISFLILLIVRSMVVRHIKHICDYFAEYAIRHRGQPLVLDKKLWVDELDQLAFSINTLLKEQEKVITLSQEKEHSYQQLAKVFYPHQLDMMRRGIQLEQTMPTGRSEAFVLAFDIIGSTKVKSGNMKEYLRRVFSACGEVMMEGYNAELLTANAFRIKEMGDGFLCSIGYPFRPQGALALADLAVAMAEKFAAITQKISVEMGFSEVIHCGIGLAFGEVETFFPSTVPCEFDLFGKAIILATRYESSRHFLFEGANAGASVIILCENVFDRLSLEKQKTFTCYKLSHWKVRDDPDASQLYYKLVSAHELAQAC